MATRCLALLVLLPLFAASLAFGRTDDGAKPTPPASAAPPSASSASAPVFVLMTTSKGDIVLQLDPDKAPISVENFLKYVDRGFYDGLVFHRVIPTFMIQGGGFTPDMKQKATDPAIKNESFNGLPNVRGSIAMARLSAPDTATSQFFINVKDNPGLDGNPDLDKPGYAVFGMVVAGMEAVDAIKAVETGTRSQFQNVPVEPVIMTKVSRLTAAEATKRIEASKAKASS